MIRFATPDDAPRIAEIHVATWRFAYRGIVPDAFLASLSVEKRAEEWRRGLHKDPRHVLLAESDGHVAGWVALGPGSDQDTKAEGEIYALYVDPAQWSRGFGRELMEKAEEELWSRGVFRIVLWVLEDNGRACRFYEALSYAADPGRKEMTLGGAKLLAVRYEKRRGC